MSKKKRNGRGGRRPGAGRKPKYSTPARPMQVSLPAAAIAALDRLAATRDVSRSELVVLALAVGWLAWRLTVFGSKRTRAARLTIVLISSQAETAQSSLL